MTARKNPSYEHVPPPDLPSVRSHGAHPSQGHTYRGTGARRQTTQKEPEPPPITGRTCRPRTQQTRDSPMRHLRGQGHARLDFPKKVLATYT